MVLVVVTYTVVQLTERRAVDPAAEIKTHLHFPERGWKRQWRQKVRIIIPVLHLTLVCVDGVDIFIAKPDAPLPFFRKQAIGDKSRILGFIVFEPVIGNLAFFIDWRAPRADPAEISPEIKSADLTNIPSEHVLESDRAVALVILNMGALRHRVNPACLNHLLPMIQPGIYIVGIHIDL